MQSIAKITAPSYYLKEQSSEYYLGGKWPVRIFGSAALFLGIDDRISKEDLARLFKGLSPDGKQLFVQNQQYRSIHKGCGKVRQKAVGWDATFSSPKSVSVAWALASPEKRSEIEAAIFEAVKKSMMCLEDHAAYTRRGQGGTRQEPVKLLSAAFMHPTSRAGDPNLHIHVVIFNIGLRRDRTTGTILSIPLYDHQKISGSIFHAELARQLEQRLSLGIDCTQNGFEIRGIPSDVCHHFSKRSIEIKKRLAELGTYTARDAERITLETRSAKVKDEPLPALFSRWHSEAQALGFSPERFWGLDNTRQQQPKPCFNPVFDQAKESLLVKREAFTERELVQRTLDASVSSGLEVDLVVKATKERLREKKEFVRLPNVMQTVTKLISEAKYLLRETFDDINVTQRQIKRLSQDRSFMVDSSSIEKLISYYRSQRTPLLDELKHHGTQLIKAARGQDTQPPQRKLIKEQAQMTFGPHDAHYLRSLTQTSGRILVIEDWPSPHRDLALKAAVQAWSRAGHSVIACTQRLKDAKRLEERTGIPTMSYRKFAHLSQPSLSFQMQWHATGLVRTALGAPTAPMSPSPLEQAKILVVDRAYRLRPDEIKLIVKESIRHNAKIVFLHAPAHGHERGDNQATQFMLNRFALPVWRNHERSWGATRNAKIMNQEPNLRHER